MSVQGALGLGIAELVTESRYATFTYAQSLTVGDIFQRMVLSSPYFNYSPRKPQLLICLTFVIF